MKLALTLALALVCGVALSNAAKLTQEEEERVFNHWLRKHKIQVPSHEHAKQWKENVLKQLAEVEEHNERYRSGNESFERALNHMSHLHPDEFRKTRHGVVIPANYKHDESKLLPVQKRSKRAADDLPAYFNWADKGIVQPAQDQGQCGSCYSFAGIAAIEAQACKNFGQCTKLSEQEAMECANECAGGWDEQIYAYASKNGGCTKETDYSYYARPINQCTADTAYFPRVASTKVVDWKIVPHDEFTIRHALYNYGPLWITLQAYDNLQTYKTGVYDAPKGKFGWHAILMTGWGTDPATKLDYWIVKNSWAETWGENGFAKIRRGVDLCKIESTKLSYPILGK